MQSKPRHDAGSNSLVGEGSRQETQCPREREASLCVVTEMPGASLHLRHRFRGVYRSVRPQYLIRPAEAAALSRGAERPSSLRHPPA